MKKKVLCAFLTVALMVGYAISTAPRAYAATTVSASDIVSTSKSLSGKYPYVWGGYSPSNGGFDCTGLIYYVYQTRLGYEMTLEQARSKSKLLELGMKIDNKTDLLPGDIIQYTIAHVGIYIGNNTVIHAGTTYGVSKVSINSSALEFAYGIRLDNVVQGNDFSNTPKQCAVCFDPQNGSVFPSTKTVVQGGTLDALPIPTRSGYTFICWSTAKEGAGAALTVDNYKWMTFDKDTTLYAHWTQDKHTHTNGAYFYSDNHPHYKFYTCTTCGEVYTDGSTTNMSSCSICNPSSNDSPLFSDGVYSLAPLCALGSRLDVAGADWRDNANVQIHESNGTLAQQWELTYLGDGYYKLICKASGKALDVSQAGTEPGTNVQQFTPNGTISQQWRIDTAADGSYFLIPRVNTNLHLDVSGAGNANGTNVQIYTANGTTAQMWDFTLVDSSSTSNSGSSVSAPQYFNCNVGIFTVKGKTVNLYNNPGDSKRVDYFDLGQAVGSSYGVNMPDGTTWYQVSVTSKGNVITVWLKYESDKMTIKNL